MIDTGDPPSLIEQLRRVHINTPWDRELRAQLDRLLRQDAEGKPLPEAIRFTDTGETRGILVIHEAGGCKSTLVHHCLSRHPALNDDDGTKRYLGIPVPSPATQKSLLRELIKQSGYPYVAARREAWSLNETLVSRIALLGIVVIWIDEAHDLFSANETNILRGIKSLMQGDAPVIPILSGTPELEDIVRSDPQVLRRFSILRLPHLDPGSDQDKIEGIIGIYCRKAGLTPPVESDLAERVIHGSRRLFGRCIENILGAVEMALDRDGDQLEIDDFAAYWSLREGPEPERNVFIVPDWWNIDPDAKANRHNAPSAKRKRRKGSY